MEDEANNRDATIATRGAMYLSGDLMVVLVMARKCASQIEHRRYSSLFVSSFDLLESCNAEICWDLSRISSVLRSVRVKNFNGVHLD